MNDHLVAAVLCAMLTVLGGLLVPTLIRRLPEPEPTEVPTPGEEETAAQRVLREEGPKELYADVAARPGLRLIAALVSGVAGALVGLVLGFEPVLVALVPLVPVGVALGVVDLRTRLLPSRVVIPATVAVLGLGLLSWPLTGDPADLVRALIGLVVARSAFWLLWAIRRAGMGFGDVRLAALLGFVLAYRGWAELAVGLYAGLLLFGLPGLAVALLRRDRSLLKKAVPYGPFMLLGALVGILAGGPILAGLG